MSSLSIIKKSTLSAEKNFAIAVRVASIKSTTLEAASMSKECFKALLERDACLLRSGDKGLTVSSSLREVESPFSISATYR